MSPLKINFEHFCGAVEAVEQNQSFKRKLIERAGIYQQLSFVFMAVVICVTLCTLLF